MSEKIALVEPLVLYAVVNHEGKFFRSRGQNSTRTQWVDEISSARFYGRSAPAAAVVSFYAKANASLPAPRVVRVTAQVAEVLEPKRREGETLKPFVKHRVTTKWNWVEIDLFFGRKVVTVNTRGAVVPNASSRKQFTNYALTVTALAAAVLSGGPPEPLADWVRENWGAINGGAK